MKSTHFNPGGKIRYAPRGYAPLNTSAAGKRIARGTVNDDNARSFGGVAAHAGLFGPMADFERWAGGLRKGFYEDNWIVSRKTVRKFFRKREGDWGLGFMKPSAGGSAGRLISRSAVGHLGYTGGSFWFDTRKDIIVLILANAPKVVKALRPRIHEEIFRYG